MTRTGVDDIGAPPRPPSSGLWNYAPAARWTQLVVPLLAVSGLLFDIVTVLEAQPPGAGPATTIQNIAIAVLYTFGLILLPYAVTWAGAVVLVTAFIAVPWASPEVPASTLVFAAGFVVALTSPAFIAGFLSATAAWAIVVGVSGRMPGLTVSVVVGAIAAGAIGFAVRRVLIERATTAAHTLALRKELAEAAARQRRVIAHELHDVVAHHITLIRMMSNVGTRGGGRVQPQELMSTIGDSAATALDELRRLLHVLDPDVAAIGSALDAADAPGSIAERVQRVAADLRTAGLVVRTEVVPDADRDVPETIRATLDRILIESTTNVLKHAGEHAECRIELARAASTITLEVSNRLVPAPHRPATAPSGYGLAGMRRRAADVGGRAWIGDENGLWVVRVVLPILA